MKKLVWFLLALGLSVSVVGCSRNAKEESEIGEEALTIENIATESRSETKEEQYETTASDNIKSQYDDLNVENLPIENQLDNYEKWFSLSHPESASKDEIIKGVVTTYYYDYEDKVPIEVLEIDDEKCIAKYNITTQKGNQYQYDLLMEKIYNNTNVSLNQDNYYATEIYLNLNMADYKVFTDTFYSKILPKSNDGLDNLIELFESYENTVFSNTSRKPYKKPYEVIDYVKLDITGAGTSGYLVVFGENNVHHGYNEYDPDISHITYYCFDSNDFVHSRYLVYKFSDSAGNFPSDIYKSNKLKEFAYLFQGGVAFDFNQNGIKEIYIAYTRSTGMSSNDNVIMVEWDGENFIPSIVHSGNINNHFSAISLSFNFDNMSLNISEEFFVPTNDIVIGMPAGIGTQAYSYYTYKWHDDEDMYLMFQKILMK